MSATTLTSKKTLGYALFDILAIAFIYFVPTISHMLKVPLYLIEPMRIAMVLALVHTSKPNAFIIAITLPIFSFLVSGHPVFYKMLIISGELVLNVWLFYIFMAKTKNAFISILSSIILSKGVYYLVKFLILAFFIKSSDNIISTPLYIQAITTLAFSAYLGLMFKKAKS